MEINGDGYGEISAFDPEMKMDVNGGDELGLSPNLFLDNVGEVILTINSDELSWKSPASTDNNDLNSSSCLGIKLNTKAETELKISDIYAVEFKNWGLIHQSVISSAGAALLVREHGVEMYRFAVHGFKRSSTKRSLWVLATYTFGNADLPTCQKWVDKINSFINKEVGRPKRLLVFVHPLSGKGNGCMTWGTVSPIFSRAKVKTKVIVTERAGHAFDVMTSLSSKELNSYDGVVAVGGDGFFNEILNGLLSSRHKAPYPPSPAEVIDSAKSSGSISHPTETTSEISQEYKEQDPLLSSEAPTRTGSGCDSCTTGESAPFPLPNERFRFGIPSGSTDAIVICTTGARDPITSALQIILGKSVRLDIAQVVRWKTTASSTDAPSVRYAASFAGYGFYGDVIRESEKYRWMGPKRYDYAGTKEKYGTFISSLQTLDPSFLAILFKKFLQSLGMLHLISLFATNRKFLRTYVFRKISGFSARTRCTSALLICYQQITFMILFHTYDISCLRSYEAEIAYLDVQTETADTTSKKDLLDTGIQQLWRSWIPSKKTKREICRMNCQICNESPETNHMPARNPTATQEMNHGHSGWLRCKGRFLSIGGAVISCRNERAPDGLVANAHLADGFLDLILIKDCPHAFYLWHLTQLARKGGKPLNFEFVEHFKVCLIFSRFLVLISNQQSDKTSSDHLYFGLCTDACFRIYFHWGRKHLEFGWGAITSTPTFSSNIQRPYYYICNRTRYLKFFFFDFDRDSFEVDTGQLFQADQLSA
ncbi:hypothetical protein C5167_049928 [Papaver somniferum]|uniref:DAGKc domain-containing protein n=1 Tax=Papaver somniferum TaxID=3469 RepID=A0A4Y7KQN1_PAPSO|nr:hypothetical protein C5167_049928 [Papaver somniferum]